MNMSLTIKARLGLTMAFLGLLLVAIGGLGYYGMTQANRAYRDTFENQMPSANAVSNAELYSARERLVFDRAAFLAGTPEAASTMERGATMRSRADGYWKKYTELPVEDAQEKQLADASNAKRLALQKLIDGGYDAVKANDQARIVESAKAMQAAYNELSGANDALRKFQFDAARQGYDAAQSAASTFETLSLGAIVIGLIAAALSWFALRRAIGRPLDEAIGHFDAIAAGDLRREVNVSSRDEMGLLLQGLARMQTSLATTVRSVRSGSESIASATKQIAAGNIDLSSRTEEQASALQETASSMDELTGTVKQNADNARQASSLAANASEIANKGSRVVAQVVGTMGDINQSSAKISDIITIIEGIAFQTNILALNAAVEAARAGEEGRGFAVVAGEVRSLAQRSSAAAKEIKGLIDTSVERVQSGTLLVDEAGRTMDEIIGAVQRVTDIMGEIAAASEEQSSGIEQVARAVTQMDEVTQQNAALVEEAAAAAQSLEDQAAKLRQAVAVFHLDDDGSVTGGMGQTASRHVSVAAAKSRPAGSPKTKRMPLATQAKPVAAAARPLAAAGGDWETF
ncbi:methyl-accepting chemotaxis sensory transducer [Caballeronia sordidicola]|uniref:Methyl-accepting chemotaxis sensory transducer n=1 Tax=Caballeronia sordidicola TaxID=196367 RepID=A0A158ICU6_CABSO|nr:methyl-accepting chemotaxis protein [Caballeronia sordidicola]SAL54432.1 methyl-accepting chemotaxis sensory transducer [Caballeronia sordidicola]